MTDVPANAVTWFQIPADDPERAWRFYGAVFGWSEAATKRDEKMRGGINGEIVARTPELNGPRLVIRVDDLDEGVARLVAAGGEAVGPHVALEKIGMKFATFRDTEGNLLNLVAKA